VTDIGVARHPTDAVFESAALNEGLCIAAAGQHQQFVRLDKRPDTAITEADDPPAEAIGH
jgi:hypothetical protein